MNTAVRVMTADPLFYRKRNSAHVSTYKNLGLMMILFASILMTAFTMVYIKDLNRRLFMQYQDLQHVKAQELTEWGKLLLEESTWSTPSRISQMAQHHLDMYIPNMQDIQLIEVQHAAKIVG